MNHQRKRFNYLSIQQRALNTPNVQEIDRASLTGRVGSIVSSNTKPQNDKQYHSVTQSYTGRSKNSSLRKQPEPLLQINENIALSGIKSSASKVFTSSTKEKFHYPIAASSTKDNQISEIYFNSSNKSQLETRIKQLQEQNSLLIKQTEQKFLQMEKHLERVELILEEKENIIDNLTNQNQKLTDQSKKFNDQNKKFTDQRKKLTDQNKKLTDQSKKFNDQNKKLSDQNKKLNNQNKRLVDQNKKLNDQTKKLTDSNQKFTDESQQLSSFKIQFSDQKKELLKMVADKNKQICSLNNQIEDFSKRQTELWSKLNQLNEENEILKALKRQAPTEPLKIIEEIKPLKIFQEIDTQTYSYEPQISQPPMKQLQTTQLQTELCEQQIEQMIQRCQQFEIDSKLNYRQKYESLFKKALEMEDQIYQLKEQLFDSESEVKTLQQQFNTYKIFNQIEKINENN